MQGAKKILTDTLYSLYVPMLVVCSTNRHIFHMLCSWSIQERKIFSNTCISNQFTQMIFLLQWLQKAGLHYPITPVQLISNVTVSFQTMKKSKGSYTMQLHFLSTRICKHFLVGTLQSKSLSAPIRLSAKATRMHFYTSLCKQRCIWFVLLPTPILMFSALSVSLL